MDKFCLKSKLNNSRFESGKFGRNIALKHSIKRQHKYFLTEFKKRVMT